MRISNENKKKFLQFFDLIIIFYVIVLFFGYLLLNEKVLQHFYIWILALVFFIILYKSMGLPYFIYDSDGETLCLTNKRRTFFLGNLKEVRKAEFPKSKLISFNVYGNFLRRKLEIVISSKRTATHKKKLIFDITFINNKEVKDIIKSLNKIIYVNSKEEEEL